MAQHEALIFPSGPPKELVDILEEIKELHALKKLDAIISFIEDRNYFRLIPNQHAKHKQPSPSVVDKAHLLLLVAKITDNREWEEQLDTLLTQHKHKHKEWPTNLETMFAVWEKEGMAALKWIESHIKEVKLGQVK